MSKHISAGAVRHVIATVSAALVVGGAVAVPVVVLPAVSTHSVTVVSGSNPAADPAATPAPTTSPDENNWG